MVLSSMSSCDFVSKAPQCPTNGLPLYREFEPEHLPAIEQFMADQAYDEARKISRFLLAARIEAMLPDGTAESVHSILWWGIRTQPALAEDPSYRASYLAAAQSLFEPDKSVREEDPFAYAFYTFMLVLDAQSEKATSNIEILRSLNGENNPELYAAYVNQIEACVLSRDEALCSPSAQINLPEEESE